MTHRRRHRPSAQNVARARHFNRFYTRLIGVLNRGFLESEYSLTEVRVLYELRQRESTTATELVQDLGIDAGYLSRILRGFERRHLLLTESPEHDRRQRMLGLSSRGKRVFDAIEARQRKAVVEMLERLAPGEQERVISAMQTIQRLLDVRAR
jgi:DNA-binding MarR family transcriptional regulator